MTDKLDVLLADLRESAAREIQPPGAAAARRTVRRRRLTTAVAAACAVVAAVGGAFTLTGRPHSAPPAVPVTSPALTGPEQLARTALAKISDGAPAFEVAEPVVAGYRREQVMYLPDLSISAACAGTGRITLVVLGDVQGDSLNRHKDRELLRLTVPCAADPVPVTKSIRTELLLDMTFRLANVEGAAGQAGFAYRVTGRGGAPLAPDDPAADVDTLLGIALTQNNKKVRAGGGTPAFTPNGKFSESGGHAEFPDERYTLAMACRGEGTYRLQFRHRGKVLVEHSVRCSWPPQRRDLRLDQPLGKDVEVWERYDADPGQIAETGWALHIR